MSNLTLAIIVIVLAALIPDLVVLVLSWLKIISLERRLEALDEMRKYVDLMEKRSTEIREESSKTRADVLSLEESFQHLNNKWIARARVEETRERKKQEKEAAQELPAGTAVEQLDAFPVPTAPEAPDNGRRQRKFGEFPR